jgi:hypothetical protein
MFNPQWEDDSQKGWGDKIYSGAAEFGMFWANVGAIIGTIIGVLLIGGGIYNWFKKDKYRNEVQGRITEATCAPVTQGNQQVQQCALKIEYMVDGKTYPFQTTRSDQFYAKDHTVLLRYNPDNPAEASMDMSAESKGLGMMLFGLIVLAIAWINWYIKRRYKFAAAAGGVGAAFDMINFGNR